MGLVNTLVKGNLTHQQVIDGSPVDLRQAYTILESGNVWTAENVRAKQVSYTPSLHNAKLIGQLIEENRASCSGQEPCRNAVPLSHLLSLRPLDSCNYGINQHHNSLITRRQTHQFRTFVWNLGQEKKPMAIFHISMWCAYFAITVYVKY